VSVPLRAGDVVCHNFFGANLIATRQAKKI